MVKLSLHAQDKLKLLKEKGVAMQQIEEALKTPDLRFFDTLHDLYVAVKRLDEDEALIVVYKEEPTDILVVTTYYTTKLNRVLRAKRERWIRLG